MKQITQIHEHIDNNVKKQTHRSEPATFSQACLPVALRTLCDIATRDKAARTTPRHCAPLPMRSCTQTSSRAGPGCPGLSRISINFGFSFLIFGRKFVMLLCVFRIGFLYCKILQNISTEERLEIEKKNSLVNFLSWVSVVIAF